MTAIRPRALPVSGSLADGAVFPARPVEVSRKFIVLACLELGKQTVDGLLHLRELPDEFLAIHYRVISR
jgi:hypothetical protein